MRRTGLVSLVLSTLLLPLGCGPNSSSTPTDTNADEKVRAAEKATARPRKPSEMNTPPR